MTVPTQRRPIVPGLTGGLTSTSAPLIKTSAPGPSPAVNPARRPTLPAPTGAPAPRPSGFNVQPGPQPVNQRAQWNGQLPAATTNTANPFMGGGWGQNQSQNALAQLQALLRQRQGGAGIGGYGYPMPQRQSYGGGQSYGYNPYAGSGYGGGYGGGYSQQQSNPMMAILQALMGQQRQQFNPFQQFSPFAMY